MTYFPDPPVKGYRSLLARLSDPVKLKVLHHLHAERLEAITDARMRRLSWNQQLTALQHNGQIQLVTWQRDCDCVEGYSSRILRVEYLDRDMDSQLQGAEGPMRFSLASPLRKLELPRSRDRIAEAFEDGHPWSV